MKTKKEKEIYQLRVMIDEARQVLADTQDLTKAQQITRDLSSMRARLDKLLQDEKVD